MKTRIAVGVQFFSECRFLSLCQASTRMVIVAVVLLVVAGCGGEKKKEVTESRNHFVDALTAIREGDSEKAIAALNASIESKPNVWAYFELAKQHLEAGDEEAALSNCEKALEMDPKFADGKWFMGELKKPMAKRFKGRFKDPPSANK